jgi:hypothetical protein
VGVVNFPWNILRKGDPIGRNDIVADSEAQGSGFVDGEED